MKQLIGTLGVLSAGLGLFFRGWGDNARKQTTPLIIGGVAAAAYGFNLIGPGKGSRRRRK